MRQLNELAVRSCPQRIDLGAHQGEPWDMEWASEKTEIGERKASEPPWPRQTSLLRRAQGLGVELSNIAAIVDLFDIMQVPKR